MDIKAAFSGISVNNLEQAKNFYNSVLGLVINNETMGIELALPGGGQLFLYEKPDHTPANFTVLNLVVENIDTAVDYLVANGVVFERYDSMPFEQDEKGLARAETAEDGPTIAWFKDPFGNIISLLQN